MNMVSPPQETPQEPPLSGRATLKVVITVFAPFAGGYFLSYLFRSVNAVAAPDLVQDIGLDAADLGLLTAVYFLTFAAAQLPLGVLLDRFGPRRVQSCLLLSAALGALVFGLGQSREMLILGRALIGLGVAGGLMASFKAIVLWFPSERIPLVNGCFMACGGIGAMSATAPVEAVLQIAHWRDLFLGLALVTLLVSAAIFLVVPERAAAGSRETLAEQVRGLKRIFGHRLFWRLAPLNCAVGATGFALQGLWAGPWLRDVAGLDRAAVADHLLVLAGAMTLGMLMTGVLAELGRRVGLSALTVMALGLGVFLLAQVAILLKATGAAYAVWALFGLFSNMNVLAYAALSQYFPASFSGRSNTGLNVLLFGSAFAAQYAIGAIIDLWPVTAAGGYAPESYQAAFGLAAGAQVLALLWFLWAGRRR
jgi:MFS family permease